MSDDRDRWTRIEVAHITASVGWLGAVVAFLVLAVAGVTSDDETTVRALYVAMEILGWARARSARVRLLGDWPGAVSW